MCSIWGLVFYFIHFKLTKFPHNYALVHGCYSLKHCNDPFMKHEPLFINFHNSHSCGIEWAFTLSTQHPFLSPYLPTSATVRANLENINLGISGAFQQSATLIMFPEYNTVSCMGCKLKGYYVLGCTSKCFLRFEREQRELCDDDKFCNTG